MAQVLEKDPATYSKERDGFIRDLQHFHDTRGTPFKKLPTISGREVDLYLLYTLVTAQGGWLKVNSKNAWPDLLQHFNLPSKCVNGSIALKQIYLRYLDRWEKVHFLGEEGDRGSDDDEEGRHKRCSARALHMVPLTYNYNQHVVNEANREFNHLSTNLFKPTDYDRLALSLISPLPNEQDFAINVCTLLSNDGKHTLKVEKNPRLLDYLLAHAGVFNHVSTRKLFLYNYNVVRKHPIHNFWDEVLDSKDILELIQSPDAVEKKDASKKQDDAPCTAATRVPENCRIETPMEVDVNRNENVITVDGSDDGELFNLDDKSDRRKSSGKIRIEPSDRDLFCLERTLGTQDYVGQRVLQIATILRNLSFIEDNVPILAKNRTFVRFILLCCCSKWNYLKNLGLDMLGNIAGEFVVRELNQDKLATALLTIITRGLDSQDRLWCLSSLEMLNKLSQNEKNEDVMLRCLETAVYEKVCSFLTIHDVMLLIYTLECLYSLSSLGERSCNLIVMNHGVVDTLVSLVTVEGKSYGPKACIGMKLVETVSGVVPMSATSVSTSNSAATTSVVQTPTPISTPVSTTTMLTPKPITTLNAMQKVISSSPATKSMPVPMPPKNMQQSTPVRTIQMAPQRLVTASPSPPTATAVPVSIPNSTSSVNQNSQPLTPQQLIQQQHAHQQAIHENEQFALAWLRATYEPCNNSKINSQELYKHYINSCTNIGRQGVISPLHFPRCVRSVFGGTVGPNPMKPSNPKDPQFYDGIKVRDHPLIINVPPSSPVPSPQPTPTPKSSRRKPKPKETSKTPPAVSKPPCSTTPSITVTQSPVNSSQGVATALASKDKSISPPVPQPPQLSPALQVEAPEGGASPASPILKAQLSAPPKQRETSATSLSSVLNKTDPKNQALAHPHLSQALLGNTSTSTTTFTTTTLITNKDGSQQQIISNQQGANTSLIKSLLANKVAERQQRLLAQQGQTFVNKTPVKAEQQQPNVKLNGARQLFGDEEVGDPSVSSTTPFANTTKGKKEPPQPPPPPLAPLTATAQLRMVRPPVKVDNEDSDSIGNNSLASSIVGVGGISSTEDGDNSLTSFEGLLNGVPNIDNPLNEDSNSKDSTVEITRGKPLRLADLLEKKIEKTPPVIINGSLGKDLKITAKGLELVENHIEKALLRDKNTIITKTDPDVKHEIQSGTKRPATDDISKVEAKKPCIENVNGNAPSPNPDSMDAKQEEADEDEQRGSARVSDAAAKLFADIAADILEDEDEEQLMQEAQQPAPAPIPVDNSIGSNPSVGQLVMDNGTGQMLITTQPRQIIVSQQNASMKQAAVAQPQQTVIVQNSSQQRTPMMLQQTNSGQILLSQGLQGQVQFVTSGQPGQQYVLQTGGTPGTYMVAQPQTAMVHGQPQTVLVAQTTQQHATGAKTIIILQQQPASANASHHQKVMVTPQGQQVVVTQVPRPVIHTSVSNIVQTSTVIKSNPASIITTSTTSSPANSNVVASQTTAQVKQEDLKSKIVKGRTAKDTTQLFICEWIDCSVTTKFKSANEVYLHACEAHCPQNNVEEVVCQWDRCDNLRRKKFSLMTHLHDKHCNLEAMKQSLLKRKTQPTVGKPEPAAPPVSTSPHPGYAPDAALHAIKRHALEFVNPKELQQKQTKQNTLSSVTVIAAPKVVPPSTDQDDNEGPVTKSIRLTASLILRNLVIYSGNCRRYLKHYESHLANVALSNVESSRTIAQILYDMNEGSNHR
ncbi:AT-rich interactive domain-containing protein 2 isoform X2 [Coccinella septempunctata]|uniref:AT-rich interactive domain-containing protein 2 isoform X2 n=1 Tax=Coccinella septempunctata TaxID=41139 RepID=UPI001D06AF52|nr:AT-rich interactive domain-containing protein 2 isoform X2 [Coccinella septempunctata]